MHRNSRNISPWSSDARPGTSSGFSNQTTPAWQLQQAVADAANEVKELLNLRKMQAASSLFAANAGVFDRNLSLLGPAPPCVPHPIPIQVPAVLSNVGRNSHRKEHWPSSGPRFSPQQRNLEPRRKRSPERNDRASRNDNKRPRTSNNQQRPLKGFPVLIMNEDLEYLVKRFAEEVDLKSVAPQCGVSYTFLKRTDHRDAKKCSACGEMVLVRFLHPHEVHTCKKRAGREKLDVLSASLAFLLWERTFRIVRKIEDVEEWQAWKLRQEQKLSGPVGRARVKDKEEKEEETKSAEEEVTSEAAMENGQESAESSKCDANDGEKPTEDNAMELDIKKKVEGGTEKEEEDPEVGHEKGVEQTEVKKENLVESAEDTEANAKDVEEEKEAEEETPGSIQATEDANETPKQAEEEEGEAEPVSELREDGMIVLDEIGEDNEDASSVHGEEDAEGQEKVEKKSQEEEKGEKDKSSGTGERSKGRNGNRNARRLLTLRERDAKRQRCAAVVASCPMCGARRRLARLGHHMTRFCPENKEACLTMDDMHAISIRSFIEEGYLSVFDGKREMFA